VATAHGLVHTVRDRARAAVVGGGGVGCAIAYWLARLGWDDVVLVERAELTSGSTFTRPDWSASSGARSA
jgi:glycine/D-amino acid oxidase-like deaminating enzyme